MVRARKYVVKNNFKGLPKREDFEVVTYEIPPIKDDEVLVKAEWISVDPYLRAYNSNQKVPYDQFSYQVGVVQESKNAEYPVGTKIGSHNCWYDNYVLNREEILKKWFLDMVYKLPDLQGLFESLGVGAVGMPGATAYFGFLDLCQPKAGETVVVTRAAGAVGSLVGQIAKLKGCRVIGFVGSDDKVKWLEQELGFDKALNYKTADVFTELKKAAPNGVDCYFDNVGGELSSIIINQMNILGRVAVCGSISSYNEDSSKLPKASILQPSVVMKQLKIEGFLVQRWPDWSNAFIYMVTWIKTGKIKVREHVTDDFDKVFDAFIGMLEGENYGKAVVKV